MTTSKNPKLAEDKELLEESTASKRIDRTFSSIIKDEKKKLKNIN